MLHSGGDAHTRRTTPVGQASLCTLRCLLSLQMLPHSSPECEAVEHVIDLFITPDGFFTNASRNELTGRALSVPGVAVRDMVVSVCAPLSSQPFRAASPLIGSARRSTLRTSVATSVLTGDPPYYRPWFRQIYCVAYRSHAVDRWRKHLVDSYALSPEPQLVFGGLSGVCQHATREAIQDSCNAACCQRAPVSLHSLPPRLPSTATSLRVAAIVPTLSEHRTRSRPQKPVAHVSLWEHWRVYGQRVCISMAKLPGARGIDQKRFASGCRKCSRPDPLKERAGAISADGQQRKRLAIHGLPPWTSRG